MTVKKETFFPQEIEESIVRHLQRTDRKRSLIEWKRVLPIISRQYRINCAEIEQLGQRNGITMRLLAVPSDLAIEGLLDYRIVDPITQKIPCRFAAIIYEDGLDQMRKGARKWGLRYRKERNLRNLSEAGLRRAVPGTDAAQREAAHLN